MCGPGIYNTFHFNTKTVLENGCLLHAFCFVWLLMLLRSSIEMNYSWASMSVHSALVHWLVDRVFHSFRLSDFTQLGLSPTWGGLGLLIDLTHEVRERTNQEGTSHRVVPINTNKQALLSTSVKQAQIMRKVWWFKYHAATLLPAASHSAHHVCHLALQHHGLGTDPAIYSFSDSMRTSYDAALKILVSTSLWLGNTCIVSPSSLHMPPSYSHRSFCVRRFPFWHRVECRTRYLTLSTGWITPAIAAVVLDGATVEECICRWDGALNKWTNKGLMLGCNFSISTSNMSGFARAN